MLPSFNSLGIERKKQGVSDISIIDIEESRNVFKGTGEEEKSFDVNKENTFVLANP